MAGENSPEARARADAYAKQQSVQLRMQKLNESKGAAVVKVGTKAQVVKGRPPIKAPLKPGATTTTVNATEAYDTDTGAFIYQSFLQGGSGQQNPPFIYPGHIDRPVDPLAKRKINRGYIRRLTEFYDKQTAGEDGTLKLNKSTPSTVTNMRCNFQFNPDNITRMVTAESDMTFFFNQDPSQLAQPVPGKAGFSFELLFNREAEVASSIYLSKDGKQMPVVENLVKGIDNLDPIGTASSWIGKPHEPQWVTKIGVLADILLLDDVVGQGLAQDILEKINSGVQSNGTTWGFDSTNSPNSPTNPSSSGTTTTKAIDQNRYDAYSMNMGNKAYLTPTPVRIMFTKWMMVEGFVQSIQVTFNKFSKNMIPTQASVMIQLQALYIGFAQQKTFLTDLPGIQLGTGTTPGNVTPDPGTKENQQYQAIDELLAKKSFFDKKDTVNSRKAINQDSASIKFKDLFKLPSKELQISMDKVLGIVKYGAELIEELNKLGINYEVKWDGIVKVYWDSHCVANDGDPLGREMFVSHAPSGYKYKTGHPISTVAPAYPTDFSTWGTKKDPMIFKSIGNIGVVDLSMRFNPFGEDKLYMSDVDGPDYGGNFGSKLTEWELVIRGGKPDFKRLDGSLAAPFFEDKFTVEVGIRWYIHDTQYDVDVYMYDWHYLEPYTETVEKMYTTNGFVTNNEWVRAPLQAMNYRIKGTGPKTAVSGDGVKWFDNVRTYIGGTF